MVGWIHLWGRGGPPEICAYGPAITLIRPCTYVYLGTDATPAVAHIAHREKICKITEPI